MTFKDGDKVIHTVRYDHESRGKTKPHAREYPAEVVPMMESRWRKRTTLRIKLVNEKTGTTVLKYVKPESLRLA